MKLSMKKIFYNGDILTLEKNNYVQAICIEDGIIKKCGSKDEIMSEADSNTEIINNICEPAGIPVIAGEENMCRGCGIATLSIDYYDIGYKAGEMAYDILVNGADVSAMEVEYAPVVEKKYNADLCESLGITVPDDYVAIEAE